MGLRHWRRAGPKFYSLLPELRGNRLVNFGFFGRLVAQGRKLVGLFDSDSGGDCRQNLSS